MFSSYFSKVTFSSQNPPTQSYKMFDVGRKPTSAKQTS